MANEKKSSNQENRSSSSQSVTTQDQSIYKSNQENKKAILDYLSDGVMSLQTIRPRFLKPAYFLGDSLTPFVAVRMHSTGGNAGVKIIELSPPSMALNKEEGITAYNANIKHFSLNGKDMSIIFTDVDVMAMESLGFLLNNIETSDMLLEVEYGWAYPQEYKSVRGILGNDNDDGIEQRCYFRRTVYMILNDIEMEYNSGSVDIVLTGSYSASFPEPFNNFMPYDFLGRYPAITLQIIHTLLCIAIFMTKISANNSILTTVDKKVKVNEEYRNLLNFLYFEKNITDVETINRLINKIFHFYRKDLLQFIKDNSTLQKATSNYITELNKQKNNILKDPKNFRPTKKDSEYFTSISKMISSLVSTKTETNPETKKIIEEINVKIKKEINNAINKTKIKSDKKTQLLTGSYLDNIEKLFDQVYKISSPTTEVEETYDEKNPSGNKTFYGTGGSIFGGSLFDIHENLREIIKKENVDFNDPLRELVIELQSCLATAKIHPWDVFKFIRDAFKIHLINFQKVNIASYSETKLKEISDSQYVEVLNFNSKENKDIYNYDINGDEQYYNYDKMSKLQDSNFLTITPSSSWEQIFNNISKEVYVKIPKETYEILTNKTSNKTDELILPLNNTFSLLYKKEALEKLKIYKILIQARKQNLKEKDNKEDETILENVIRKVSGINVNAPIFVNYLDVNDKAGSIFDQQVGKNSIIQAYSYRTGGVLQKADSEDFGRFNPGYPNVLSINFPDVRNLNIKFNYNQMVSNIKSLMREKIPKISFIDEDKLNLLNEQIKRLEDKKSINKDEKELLSSLKKEKEKNERRLEPIHKQQKQYQKIVPYTHPSSLLFNKDIRNGYNYTQIKQQRKAMQEYRKHLLLDYSNVTASLTILGDPIYDIMLNNKYIFIKILNPDGSLSFFTGIYRINNFNHEINTGSFVTTLELTKDNTINSDVIYQLTTQMDDITFM